MKQLYDGLSRINQSNLLAKRVDENMSRLVSEAELVARLDEAQAVDKQLVEDYRCSICICFTFDPVMCSECDHVFCLACRKGYYSKPTNVTCSDCRVEAKERYKPLNKKLRKKIKRLKFECQGCKSILSVNDKCIGRG
jgi:hypothetical protein